MNCIAKKQMAEGLLYGFHFPARADNATVDFCVAIKDMARAAGVVVVANQYGQIEVLDRETRAEVARALFI